MSSDDAIRKFLDADTFAVVGASRDTSKFGNKVLRSYLSRAKNVVAVNPNEVSVEGVAAWPSLAAIPRPPQAVSIVTPPPVTEAVVDEGLALGIRLFWMQPGAESQAAVEKAEAAGATVIHGGPCVLVELG